MPDSNPPVFFDPAGRRRRGVNGLAAALSGLLLISGAVTLLSLWLPDALPGVSLHRQPHNLHPASLPPVSAANETPWQGVAAPNLPLKTTAFFVAWDDNSLSSLKRNINALDGLVPEWWHLGAGGALQPESPGKNANMLKFVREKRPALPVMPLVNNYDPQAQAWASARVAAVMHDPVQRAALVQNLVSGVTQNHFAGLNLDFENLPDSAQNDYAALVRQLSAALHRAGKKLTVDVPLDDPAFQYKALGQWADSVVLMAYDEHEETSDAGAIASQGWVEQGVRARLKDIPAAHMTVALGSYGYDWAKGGNSELSFQDALSLAKDAGVKPHLDSRTLNLTFQYQDSGTKHTVWYLDAVSVFDQAQALRSLGVRQVALWRMGSEDPGVWVSFKQGASGITSALASLQAGYDIDYQGQGELLKVSGRPQAGARTVTLAHSHLLTGETVRTFATPYVIERWGEHHPRQLALTFDDGPDPLYTPRILDILKKEHVPGTFFIVGLHGEANPELLRRIVQEGNQIGTHTFTHPDLSLVSARQFKLELNATQRLIEGETGRRTLLFRPPFAEDVEPETPDQAGIVERASRLGYFISGMGIDPNDWRRPGVAHIVQQTVAQVQQGDGQVILLHDAGGNREQTVAALPIIIEKLRGMGYTFTTVSQVAGVPDAQANPPVSRGQQWLAHMLGADFTAVGWLGAALGWLFKMGVTLSVARLLFIVVMALREASQRRTQPAPRPAPLGCPFPTLTVIVPAFNEARVIRATLASLLASDLPGLQVLVVDDGSTDGTAQVARAAYGQHPQVTIHSIPNGGKARALNYALKTVQSDVVLILDADTQINPQAARLLAQHFLDPQVVAVAGNAKVGNRVNLLTRWQALEYITAQNVERRALSQLNAVSVVPGAIGAWRTAELLRLGGFQSDTLAEDADLTMRALRAGHRVSYDLGAVARTEAPETLRAFIKQRDRWMFGTLQATWKQRDAWRSRARGLGFFTLPNVVLFQVLFPLVGAVLDISFITSLAWALLQWHYHPDGGFSPTGPVLIFTGLFILIDALAAALAFALESSEDWRLLPLLIPQRIIYRQLMSYVAIRAVIAALKGQQRGWNKLERQGSVQAGAKA